MARTHTVLPIHRTDRALALAVHDPLDKAVVRAVEGEVGLPVEILLAPASDLRRAIDAAYRGPGQRGPHVEAFQAAEPQRRTDVPLHAAVSAEAPVVQVVNLIITQGLCHRRRRQRPAGPARLRHRQRRPLRVRGERLAPDRRHHGLRALHPGRTARGGDPGDLPAGGGGHRRRVEGELGGADLREPAGGGPGLRPRTVPLPR